MKNTDTTVKYEPSFMPLLDVVLEYSLVMDQVAVIESTECGFVVVAGIWNKLRNYCNEVEK